MTDGIIIGSYAADAGGFLPEWRGGEVNDLDIVCREDHARRLAGERNPHAPYRIVAGNLDIDFDPVTFDRLAPLCQNTIDLTHGRYRLAPLEVVWATLYYTAGCVASRWEKSFRDLVWYDGLVKSRGALTRDHWELAEYCRASMLETIASRFEPK